MLRATSLTHRTDSLAPYSANYTSRSYGTTPNVAAQHAAPGGAACRARARLWSGRPYNAGGNKRVNASHTRPNSGVCGR